MAISKVIVGVSIVCGVALTLFIWMPLFAIGGVFGIASSFFGDGFKWYGRLYADRDEDYRVSQLKLADETNAHGEISLTAAEDESIEKYAQTPLRHWTPFPEVSQIAWR